MLTSWVLRLKSIDLITGHYNIPHYLNPADLQKDDLVDTKGESFGCCEVRFYCQNLIESGDSGSDTKPIVIDQYRGCSITGRCLSPGWMTPYSAITASVANTTAGNVMTFRGHGRVTHILGDQSMLISTIHALWIRAENVTMRTSLSVKCRTFFRRRYIISARVVALWTCFRLPLWTYFWQNANFFLTHDLAIIGANIRCVAGVVIRTIERSNLLKEHKANKLCVHTPTKMRPTWMIQFNVIK